MKIKLFFIFSILFLLGCGTVLFIGWALLNLQGPHDVDDPPTQAPSTIPISVNGGNGSYHSFIHGDQLTFSADQTLDWSGINIDPDYKQSVPSFETKANLPPAGYGRGSVVTISVNATLWTPYSIGHVDVTQDILDGLRQEYYDFSIQLTIIPARLQFTQISAPQQYPFLKRVEDWHQGYWIPGNLAQHATDVDGGYGGSLNVTSGYRCPVHNASLENSSTNSNHLFGRAFDFQQIVNGVPDKYENHQVFQVSLIMGANGDTYLEDDQGRRYRWDVNPPPDPISSGPNYVKGHTAWL